MKGQMGKVDGKKNNQIFAYMQKFYYLCHRKQ